MFRVLKIPHDQISEIETKYLNDVSKCREKMVEIWFQNANEVSWKTLCAALRDPSVGRPDIASRIELKYKN